MASRKEEKERLRSARLEKERTATHDTRRRLWLGYLVAGVITAAVISGIVIAVIGTSGGDSAGGGASIDPTTGVVFEDLEPDDRTGTALPVLAGGSIDDAAEAAKCTVERDLRDEGAEHLSPDAPVPNYRTNPPSSGNHSPDPLADGAYQTTPSPLNFVHSLEHGRVQFQYDPSLPEADQLAIKGLFDNDPAGMIMFPNPDLDGAVAASAWTRVLNCESFEGDVTLAALSAFRSEFRGRGPEPVPF
jgi:hypothetical protein